MTTASYRDLTFTRRQGTKQVVCALRLRCIMVAKENVSHSHHDAVE